MHAHQTATGARIGDLRTLTPAQITRLRRAVIAAQERPLGPGLFREATCVDGPLAGLTVLLKRAIALEPRATFGWATLTEAGLIVAYYEQSGVSGRWRFRGYERPGMRS